MSKTEDQKAPPKSKKAETLKPTAGKKTKAATSGEGPAQAPRGSIFDEAFSPIGSERRKQWSRHIRKDR